jgi:hypothetical protein
VLFASAISLARGAPPVPPAPGHPILGMWKFALPDGSCSEIYLFRPDGTSLVTSGEEISESVYEVAAKPSAKGFYKWVDRIAKDNGKKDCAGQITQPGRETTNFIRLDPSGEMFIVCPSESLEACFGPLRRVHGVAT